MDDLLQQIGLLLTQMRYARRALEDIERSTSHYNSFAFAAALGQGARFGEPPMFGGALKVWVVNINDLAPSAGGGFLEQILGGIGRFIGGVGSGFAGGLLGGLFGGWNLPDLIPKVQKLADTIERILTKLGTDFNKKDDKKEEDKSSLGLLGQLNAFTSLFLAASGQTDQAASLTDSLTPAAQEWKRIIDSTLTLVTRIDSVVRGLTFLIPVVIGALADFVFRLDTIKLAVVELMQFLVREILLLRGVILVTIFDTLSSAAQAGASLMGVLSIAFSEIATSIFAIFGGLLTAAQSVVKFLAEGLMTTVNALATWLVTLISTVLANLANSVVFQEIVHVVDVLPLILPPLIIALQGPGAALGKSQVDALTDLANKSLARPSSSGSTPVIALPDPTKIPDTLIPPDKAKDMSDQLTKSLDGVKKSIDGVFGSSQAMLNTIRDQANDDAKDKLFNAQLAGHIDQIKGSSKNLAGAFQEAADVAAKQAAKGPTTPTTGLDAVAMAYEAWLSGDGMQTMLKDITTYFSKPGAADVYKDKAIGPTTIDRPRATIDIQDVIIEIKPPEEKKADKVGSNDGLLNPASLQNTDDTLALLVELLHELNERGGRFDEGSLLSQV
jgi:hypothetical protein